MPLWTDQGRHRRRRDWLRNSMIGSWSVVVLVIAGMALAIKGCVPRRPPRRSRSEMVEILSAVMIYCETHG
ncbi:MAG: hypothetical protein ACYSU0_22305, partial [Planctomycetota bacterium]